MKDYQQLEPSVIIKHAMPLSLAASTDFFYKLKSELGFDTQFENWSNLKSLFQEFAKSVLSILNQETVNADKTLIAVEDELLVQKWHELCSNLEAHGAKSMVFDWLEEIINLSQSKMFLETNWLFILIKWVSIDGTVRGPKLDEKIYLDLKIAILQSILKVYQWESRIKSMLDPSRMNDWERLIMEYQGGSAWIHNNIRKHHKLEMWIMIFEMLDKTQIDVVSEWGKQCMTELELEWQAEYELNNLYKKLLDLGYLKK
ncbi:MAG: hypothetical protein Crog4KO_35000 [Crocinitomicaceae bacterium]